MSRTLWLGEVMFGIVLLGEVDDLCALAKGSASVDASEVETEFGG